MCPWDFISEDFICLWWQSQSLDVHKVCICAWVTKGCIEIFRNRGNKILRLSIRIISVCILWVSSGSNNCIERILVLCDRSQICIVEDFKSPSICKWLRDRIFGQSMRGHSVCYLHFTVAWYDCRSWVRVELHILRDRVGLVSKICHVNAVRRIAWVRQCVRDFQWLAILTQRVRDASLVLVSVLSTWHATYVVALVILYGHLAIDDVEGTVIVIRTSSRCAWDGCFNISVLKELLAVSWISQVFDQCPCLANIIEITVW